MDLGGAGERDFIHETDGQRGGDEGRGYCEPKVNTENGLNQSREYNGRTENSKFGRKDHREDQEPEKRNYKKRDEDELGDIRPEAVEGVNNGQCDPYPTQRRPRHRDIRHVNYAFSGPGDDAAQEWFDNLSIAGQEEDKPLKIWPKGRKYRSGDTNASPQMLERLQRCEEDQEPHTYRIQIPRHEKKNVSTDIYPLLHADDNQSKSEDAAPLKPWGNTRRSCVCNESSGVYAVMHPSSGNNDGPVKRNLKKNSRNHLKEHRAAITEMSALTHFYKQKENEEEAKRQAAMKLWDGSNRPKKKFPKKETECNDFVERNKEAIKEMSQHTREVRDFQEPGYSFVSHKGKLPKYLRQRKKELLEEVEERKREVASLPAPEGRRMMSEEERLQTLENLEQRYEELIKVLRAFPLAFDTAHQIRIRAEVEQELKEIEASHSYYSNPKIYIAEVPSTPQRTSHSQFPLLDQTPEVSHENDKDQRTVSPSAISRTIPMTYYSSRCETCHAPMQRVIKAPDSRKPIRCTACTLKARTRNRSLWPLHKPVKQRAPQFSSWVNVPSSAPLHVV